jgi:hypothetical protein
VHQTRYTGGRSFFPNVCDEAWGRAVAYIHA